MLENNFYDQFIKRFAAVGKERSDLKAAYVIGSRARKEYPADQWSDLDILLYTDQPEYYLEAADFVSSFGTIWSSFSTKTLGNDAERLILFEGGYQVDLVVKTAVEFERYITEGKVPWLFKRGTQIIVDNTGTAAKLLPEKTVLPEKQPLNQQNFDQVNQMFWFVTMYIAKQLLRKENWSAKVREMEYKMILLQVIEWYEQSLHGLEYDTWHGGRFLEKWVEPDLYQAIAGTYGNFELASLWQALIESMELFTQLTQAISAREQLTLDSNLGENITNWINGKRAK
ncbi:aminoglycoside 6-adenylyltransferase [Enterococcus sp. 665A]|uniref:Aminoglycoside 6-adenylyltransferase n=1 Tax=Candidatus Enterococcus ferrettii TaxID=2815324 RepID=A0ABV0EN90_9ENTE